MSISRIYCAYINGDDPTKKYSNWLHSLLFVSRCATNDSILPWTSCIINMKTIDNIKKLYDNTDISEEKKLPFLGYPITNEFIIQKLSSIMDMKTQHDILFIYIPDGKKNQVIKNWNNCMCGSEYPCDTIKSHFLEYSLTCIRYLIGHLERADWGENSESYGTAIDFLLERIQTQLITLYGNFSIIRTNFREQTQGQRSRSRILSPENNECRAVTLHQALTTATTYTKSPMKRFATTNKTSDLLKEGGHFSNATVRRCLIEGTAVSNCKKASLCFPMIRDENVATLVKLPTNNSPYAHGELCMQIKERDASVIYLQDIPSDPFSLPPIKFMELLMGKMDNNMQSEDSSITSLLNNRPSGSILVGGTKKGFGYKDMRTGKIRNIPSTTKSSTPISKLNKILERFGQ